MSKWWSVAPRDVALLITRDITWGDIKACVGHLSLNCEAHGGEGEEFAPLHSVEGGFMCVTGPGFKTNEPVDSKLANQPRKEDGDASVRKSIHFEAGVYPRWPSRNGSFLDNPNLNDDTVVLPEPSDGLLMLRFEGENCNEWTTWQCQEYTDIISDELNAMPIHAKLAAKLKCKEAKRRKLNPPKLNPPKFKPEQFKMALEDLTTAVLFCGNSDVGKTQFAKAHFKNPHLVSQNEGMKNFDPAYHDGIIFDDMCFKTWSYYDVVHLLDMDFDRTIPCKYGSYTIPANTKKIFTSQQPDIFECKGWKDLNDAQKHAVCRRFRLCRFPNRLF